MSETKQSILRDYILNTSFHGFRFLAQKGLHWTERFFWAIVCVLSWICTGLLILSSWDDFQNNAISFVVDTNYLEWDTHFPSIAVCESDNQDRIAAITDSTFGDPHDYNLDEVVRESVFYHGISFYTLEVCGPDSPTYNDNCLKKNLSDFTQLIRSTCTEIFKTCQWNEQQFDCCQYFHRIDTELGWCYIINSIQHRQKANLNKYKMISNYKTGPGTLKLELNGYIAIYILGEQEVPSLTTLASDSFTVTSNVHHHRYMSVKEIENEPEVKDVSVRQRKCKFEDEADLNVYPHYSYSACCVQCRKNAQLKKCGCTHHLVPNTPSKLFCNITGLQCLNKYYSELSVLKPSWSNRVGLSCDCLPSCTEIEVSVVKDERLSLNADYGIAEITLNRLPSERYKRNVVRGKLDLVVSMGGSTALFLGASILSFVEIIYYFTLRIINNRKIAKQQQLEQRKFRFGSSNIVVLPKID